MEIGLLKNCFAPEEPPYRADGIGEGRFRLFVARSVAEVDRVTLGMFGVDQADDAEQSQQA